MDYTRMNPGFQKSHPAPLHLLSGSPAKGTWGGHHISHVLEEKEQRATSEYGAPEDTGTVGPHKTTGVPSAA